MPHVTRILIASVLLCAAVYAQPSGSHPEIIIYGRNAPEWNKALGVTATRGGCALLADQCLKNVTSLLNSQNTSRFYLNLGGDPRTMISNAKALSQLSIDTEPRLYEVGIDDFWDQYSKWCREYGSECRQLYVDLVRAIKSSNPHLRFGITVYEDHLAPIGQALTKDMKAEVDSVHLYLHYRESIKGLLPMLQQAEREFPNAQIFLGIYAYDRADYAPCAGPGSRPCSEQDEQHWFSQYLKAAVELMHGGKIAGIEFYPGFFGLDDQYTGWDNPRVCAPERRAACKENTRMMHKEVWDALHP